MDEAYSKFISLVGHDIFYWFPLKRAAYTGVLMSYNVDVPVDGIAHANMIMKGSTVSPPDNFEVNRVSSGVNGYADEFAFIWEQGDNEIIVIHESGITITADTASQRNVYLADDTTTGGSIFYGFDTSSSSSTFNGQVTLSPRSLFVDYNIRVKADIVLLAVITIGEVEDEDIELVAQDEHDDSVRHIPEVIYGG